MYKTPDNQNNHRECHHGDGSPGIGVLPGKGHMECCYNHTAALVLSIALNRNTFNNSFPVR